MKFDSLQAFLDMGGYGFYVWLSFGVTFLFISVLIASSVMGHKRTLTEIQQRLKREEKLKQAAQLQAQARQQQDPSEVDK